MIESGINPSLFLAIAPVVAITTSQVRSIMNRDNRECKFTSPHDCQGKLTVHHIDGKKDDPENLITVCRISHWDILHNGASEEQLGWWAMELFKIAKERTKKAKARGWAFPKDPQAK